MFRKASAIGILLVLFSTYVTLQGKTVEVSPNLSSNLKSASNSTGQNSMQKLEYFEEKNSEKAYFNCSTYIVEKQYILLENGSVVIPGLESIYEYNSYYLNNDTAFICADTVINSLETTTVDSGYNFSDEFLKCGHILIEPHEFAKLENGSIFIPIYAKVYGVRDYYMQEHGVYVCVPRFEEMNHTLTDNGTVSDSLNKFSETFAYVTYVGLLVSICSLMAHLAVFCVVSSVRNLPGCCLASLSFSLLMAYFCFLILAVVETTDHCANLGMCVYYFFLTSFFWMNAIAFDVWRSFRVVMRELRISSHRIPWKRFLAYSSYSWLIPACLTILVKVADSTDVLPVEYRPAFGAPICWFSQRKALLIFFAAPLCVVMLLNAIFFLDVTYVISRATLKTSHSHEATLKKRFFMFMRLALIMGLTWIVGLIAGYADNVVLWYFFVVLNTLQGLFIFIVFSCSSKVKVYCCRKHRKRSKSRGSTSVRTISQMSAAV